MPLIRLATYSLILSHTSSRNSPDERET